MAGCVQCILSGDESGEEFNYDVSGDEDNFKKEVSSA